MERFQKCLSLSALLSLRHSTYHRSLSLCLSLCIYIYIFPIPLRIISEVIDLGSSPLSSCIPKQLKLHKRQLTQCFWDWSFTRVKDEGQTTCGPWYPNLNDLEWFSKTQFFSFFPLSWLDNDPHDFFWPVTVYLLRISKFDTIQPT